MSDEIKKNITRIGDYPIQPGQDAKGFEVAQPEIGEKPIRKEGESVMSFGARMSAFQRNEQLNQFIIKAPSGKVVNGPDGKPITFKDINKASGWLKDHFPSQPDTVIVKYNQKIKEDAVSKLNTKMQGEQVEFTREEIKALKDANVYIDIEPKKLPTEKEKDTDALEKIIEGQGTEADSMRLFTKEGFEYLTPGKVKKEKAEGYKKTLVSLNKERKSAISDLKQIKNKIKDSIDYEGADNKQSKDRRYNSILTALVKSNTYDELITDEVYQGDIEFLNNAETLFDEYKEQSEIIKSIQDRIKTHRKSK